MGRLLPWTAAILTGVALAAPAASAPKVRPMVIRDMAFQTSPQVLHVGDRLDWVNSDIFRHSVTARDMSFDLDLPPGAHGQITLKRAGQVAFYCRYHPGMRGQLTVAK